MSHLLLFLTLFILSIVISKINLDIYKLFVLLIGTSLLFLHLTFQVKNLDISLPENALKTFKSNRNTGFILVLTLIGISL